MAQLRVDLGRLPSSGGRSSRDGKSRLGARTTTGRGVSKEGQPLRRPADALAEQPHIAQARPAIQGRRVFSAPSDRHGLARPPHEAPTRRADLPRDEGYGRARLREDERTRSYERLEQPAEGTQVRRDRPQTCTQGTHYKDRRLEYVAHQ